MKFDIKTIIKLLILLTACAVAYIPAVKSGFIWDDDAYVTGNKLIKDPDGLHKIWFTAESPSQYFPLVYTSFWAEYKLWGLNPFGYHLVNVIIHAANALLVWIILTRLGIPGAWLGAMIFCLHPVQVESVAWVTERKNVLMGFFFLLSLIFWDKFITSQAKTKWPLFLLSIILYILSLCSKTTACTMPAAVVLILWLRDIKIDFRKWLLISVYVFLGVAMGLLAMWWEKYHQGTGLIVKIDLSLTERFLVASRAVWFYLWKLIWPFNITFSYPKWKINADEITQYFWLILTLAAAGSMWYWRQKIGKKTIAAFTFFVATLLPMLGFIMLLTFMYSYVADHYQYLACIGPIAVFAALLHYILKKARPVFLLCAAGIIIFLGFASWQQCHAYKDLKTLWTDTLKKNPGSYMAVNNLGALYALEGNLPEAEIMFQKSAQMEPNYPEPYINLGLISEEKGDLNLAIEYYQKAIQVRPQETNYYYKLATLYNKTGDAQKAFEFYNKAVIFEPDNWAARNEYAFLLKTKGDYEHAEKQLLAAAALRPNFAGTYFNLGALMVEQQKLEQAQKYLEKAVEIDPNFIDAQHNLGMVYQQQGKTLEAKKQLLIIEEIMTKKNQQQKQP